MNKIFTGLDIGNGEIKIVVVSADDSNYYVLTTTSVKTNGLKKNIIYDDKKLKASLLNALKITEEKIGMKIREVILTLPANRASMTIESGLVNIRGETVKGKDIDAVIKDTVEDTYDDTRELVSCLPISFTVDDEASVINPLYERGDKLFLKAVVATSPKEEIYPFINLVRSIGVNITDIIYNTQNYLLLFINIFVSIIAVISAIIVANHTGSKICVGFCDPIELLTAITVVGISSNEAVFITINIAIEFVKVSFLGLSFCNVFITFNPVGVAAFPSPKRFAIIFIDISFLTLSFFLISGNKNLIIGCNKFVSLAIILVLVAISIIPFHKHIVPNKFIDNCTALSVDSNIELFTFAIFPDKKAYTNDTIINAGQMKFNILTPLLLNFIQKNLKICAIFIDL